jgi:hypothetical protein
MNPEPSRKGKPHVWTRKHIAMLGTIPDAALARRISLSVGTVLKKRQKLGIPASRPAKSLNWTPAIIAMLGKFPDGEIARIHGMNILSLQKNGSPWASSATPANPKAGTTGLKKKSPSSAKCQTSMSPSEPESTNPPSLGNAANSKFHPSPKSAQKNFSPPGPVRRSPYLAK